MNPTPVVPVFDPAQIMLQGGAFGLACYLVYFVTHDMHQTLLTIAQAITLNTASINALRDKLNEHRATDAK